MEVIAIESNTFQELVTMFRTVCNEADTYKRENKKLKEKKLLSAREVADLTGFNEKTIKLKKEEIGYFTDGKDVKFKPENVDAWIEERHIKPRAKRK